MGKVKTLGIVLIVLLIAIPIVSFIGIAIPADTQYNRKFTSHETMAHDSASFEKMREQIMIIWNTMNETWSVDKFSATWNTWYGPDQTYENSIQATNDYYNGLVSRIDATIVEMHQIEIGNKTILTPYNAYYNDMLDSFRNETVDKGGLLWAIHGAWYLSFAPAAYWMAWWLIPLMIALGIFGIIAIIIGMSRDYEARERRREEKRRNNW
jgi:hypothetical protein